MRSHFKALAILVIVLFASTAGVVAQTGDFASPVPGYVVHQGYALQDWWQNARNSALVNPPIDVVPVQRKPKRVTKNSRIQSR
jgi:hypothetical protein